MNKACNEIRLRPTANPLT